MIGEKRNARPSAATLEQAVENGTASQTAHASTTNDTTPPAENQQFRIADFLHCGVENAISRRDLMSLTGLRDRELRRMIETERRRGIPILSDNANGYFLPGDEVERERCVKSLRRRAREIEKTADAIERTVRD